MAADVSADEAAKRRAGSGSVAEAALTAARMHPLLLAYGGEGKRDSLSWTRRRGAPPSGADAQETVSLSLTSPYFQNGAPDAQACRGCVCDNWVRGDNKYAQIVLKFADFETINFDNR